jgi:nitrogenase molybdenum-iron protein alpha chain
MAITDKQLEDLLVPYTDIVKKNRKKHLIVKNSAEACQQI